MSISPAPDELVVAQQYVRQGKFRNLQEALAAIRAGQAGDPTAGAAPEGVVGGPVDQSRGMRPPAGSVGGPVDQSRGMRPPASANAVPSGQIPGTRGGPSGPGRGPGDRPPGYYKAGAAPGQDRYGDAMRGNTNAAGIQSNGDDDPWLIGAAEGTTYDPETMERWYKRAMAGDGKAAWVLRQVGFLDERNRPVFAGQDGLEQWAASRKLDRRAAQGAATPWYHDPKNWGADQGFTGADDAAAAYAAAPWHQLREEGDRPSDYPSRRPRRPEVNPEKFGPGPAAAPAMPDTVNDIPPGSMSFDGPRSGFDPDDWEEGPIDPADPAKGMRLTRKSNRRWY